MINGGVEQQVSLDRRQQIIVWQFGPKKGWWWKQKGTHVLKNENKELKDRGGRGLTDPGGFPGRKWWSSSMPSELAGRDFLKPSLEREHLFMPHSTTRWIIYSMLCYRQDKKNNCNALSERGKGMSLGEKDSS